MDTSSGTLAPRQRRELSFRIIFTRRWANNLRSAHPPLIIPEFPSVPSRGVAQRPEQHHHACVGQIDRAGPRRFLLGLLRRGSSPRSLRQEPVVPSPA